MSKHSATSGNGERIVCTQPAIGRLVLGRFDLQHDSWEHLTKLLHGAFAKLASLGLHCACVDQPATVTRPRAASPNWRSTRRFPHRT